VQLFFKKLGLGVPYKATMFVGLAVKVGWQTTMATLLEIPLRKIQLAGLAYHLRVILIGQLRPII
jgi:hypothetical protein